jgi:hypothetical protein
MFRERRRRYSGNDGDDVPGTTATIFRRRRRRYFEDGEVPEATAETTEAAETAIIKTARGDRTFSSLLG